ncbi:hypothetical protein [Clostridium cochlearium]|uniref:HEPN domain-containing protein n=1 Tax=Clostridium cochlearium TaxID=1494 RepID=A0ABY0QLV3_CLOCO|nr:hypothetical protein [Clostridium cochlearium]SDL20288.1 hypothetical protein SAMN05216497_1122 [Clostridium cochlearium]
MDFNKIEDSIMKNAMDIFKQSAVDFYFMMHLFFISMVRKLIL